MIGLTAGKQRVMSGIPGGGGGVTETSGEQEAVR